MVTEGPTGERLRVYRRRQGLSQAALAGLVGRSESWLSQVERGIRSVDRLSVLIDIARVLKVDVETLAGRPFSLAPNGGPELVGLGKIRTALSSYPSLGVSPAPMAMTLAEVRRLTGEAHRLYQAADYGHAARLLPGLIISIDALAAGAPRDAPRDLFAVQSSVYIVTAKLVTKVGEAQLAWLAADRAATAALHAEDMLLSASAAYQVACALLKNDQPAEAERIALTSAEALADRGPVGLSLRGALTLIGAIIAGRRNDRGDAIERLAWAEVLAHDLGEDANYGWTGFGPQNVRIHRVSTAVELGDALEAIARAEALDTNGLPAGLQSRRAQVHIDSAWAYAQRRQDTAAVVSLLEAERMAAQALRYNVVVRELLREMLKRERRAATPGLRPLAQRAGVIQ